MRTGSPPSGPTKSTKRPTAASPSKTLSKPRPRSQSEPRRSFDPGARIGQPTIASALKTTAKATPRSAPKPSPKAPVGRGPRRIPAEATGSAPGLSPGDGARRTGSRIRSASSPALRQSKWETPPRPRARMRLSEGMGEGFTAGPRAEGPGVEMLGSERPEPEGLRAAGPSAEGLGAEGEVCQSLRADGRGEAVGTDSGAEASGVVARPEGCESPMPLVWSNGNPCSVQHYRVAERENPNHFNPLTQLHPQTRDCGI